MGYGTDHPIYTQLKTAISSGEIAPGVHLNIGELAQRFNTSAAPLREALVRLAGEDMVDYDFSRGYFARQISFTDLSDAFDLMALILLDGLDRLGSHLSQTSAGQLTGLFYDSEERSLSNDGHCASLQSATKVRSVLLSPVAERQFNRLSMITLPFQVGTARIEHPDFPEKALVKQLIDALNHGDLPHATSVVQDLSAKRRRTLHFFFEAYEKRQRMAQRL